MAAIHVQHHAGGEAVPERIGNMNALRRRWPALGPRHRDTRYQTRTPATPGADGTVANDSEARRRSANAPAGIELATAKLFHSEGARVIVTGKNRATLPRPFLPNSHALRSMEPGLGR